MKTSWIRGWRIRIESRRSIDRIVLPRSHRPEFPWNLFNSGSNEIAPLAGEFLFKGNNPRENVIYFRRTIERPELCRIFERNFTICGRSGGKIANEVRKRPSASSSSLRICNRRRKRASPVCDRPTFEYWNPIQIQVERVAMKIHSRHLRISSSDSASSIPRQMAIF